ncbi:eukaryotic translation initiation factor eIF2A-domain-containing protein [Gaertneriomyces semiglobifer]|nr:eukaryotic translation initiation factor eIF2A-domain-containing protein [Gaertneriomyces semiglobifer]
MATAVPPPPQFAYRSNTGFQVATGPPEVKNVEGFVSPEDDVRTFVYSPDGRFLALLLPSQVRIHCTSTHRQVLVLPRPGVLEIAFSPNGNYVSTFERFVKTADAETNPHKNLVLWDVSTGAEINAFTQKQQQRWNVEWTRDESYYAKLVTNEIQFFSKQDFTRVCSRLKMEGVSHFGLSSGQRAIVAVFVPEKKGQPASVKLYDVLGNFAAPLAQKSFFRADSCVFHWNKLGTAVLVFTHTDVDATGKSYYGETNLYYLAIAGTFDARVELNKPGPIHDVSWNPNSKEFVVVYGTMPAQITLFDHRASPLYSFGEAPRNVCQFNAHGRLLLVGGFGNLAGDIDIWDRKNFKKLVTINAPNTSVCEWAPDGRYVMTATVYKRLKVDNGVKLWHHTGVCVDKRDVKELHQVAWRPAPADLYPEPRSLSPPPQSTLPAVPVVTKPAGVYRPPGARGMASAEGSAPPGANFVRQRDQRVPGLSGEKKGKKKRNGEQGGQNQNQNQQQQQQQRSANGVAAPTTTSNGNGTPTTGTPTGVTTTGTTTSGGAPGGAYAQDLLKKHKNISKKLKAIEDIKQKIARGEKVELTQLKKMEGEQGVKKELEGLEGEMRRLGMR